MVTTGRYNVVNCGGNSSLIVNLLNRLYFSLLPVIEDAKSTEPSPAYTAFFKDPSYALFISAVFTNITRGVPLTPPAPYSSNGAPVFLCVTAPDQFTYRLDGPKDAYTDCVADPTMTSDYLGFSPPRQYIILCPSFFTSNLVSVPPLNTCLTVNTSINKFRGNGLELRVYKMWILLAMITHYYLYVSTGISATINTNDVNKCLRLAANQSLLNANNYLYYAASLYGHCNDFPDPPTNGRGVLEIDTEDPSDNGTDVASSAVVTFIATDLEIGV